MSYLLRGSSTFSAMGWVDRVPRAGKLYIGGLHALYQTNLIRAAGITHVLSVIDYDPLLRKKFAHLKHLHIRADDHPNEDLLQYFAEAVKYIDQALKESDRAEESGEEIESLNSNEKDGGGVFVHCAMGKSRSATLVVAYLMWKYHMDSESALAQLCEGRPVCDPNPGFKEQLKIWETMCQSDTEKDRMTIYEDWKKNRFTGEYWEWDSRVAGFKTNL